MKAYLGLGTNIGERLNNLQNAIDAIGLLPYTRITAVSNVYETKPVGFSEQDDFLNIVLEVETDVNSDILLGYSLGIEAALGRVRTIKNGPRIIDIDLLLYGEEVKNTDKLILPHPRMLERGFVLVPLMDLNINNKLVDMNSIKQVSYDGVKLFCSGDKLTIN